MFSSWLVAAVTWRDVDSCTVVFIFLSDLTRCHVPVHYVLYICAEWMDLHCHFSRSSLCPFQARLLCTLQLVQGERASSLRNPRSRPLTSFWSLFLSVRSSSPESSDPSHFPVWVTLLITRPFIFLPPSWRVSRFTDCSLSICPITGTSVALSPSNPRRIFPSLARIVLQWYLDLEA